MPPPPPSEKSIEMGVMRFVKGYQADPEVARQYVAEAAGTYLSPELEGAREVVQKVADIVNDIDEQAPEYKTDVIRNVAAAAREGFTDIQNQDGAVDIVDALDKTNIQGLFESVQQAKELGLFEKLKNFMPAGVDQEAYNNFVKEIGKAKNPEEFKEIAMGYLKDPRNAGIVEEVKSVLKVALQQPRIGELVEIATNPGLIETAVNVVNSEAGKNLTKVLAERPPSFPDLVGAGMRMTATVLQPQNLYHIPSLVKAAYIVKSNAMKSREKEVQSMRAGLSQDTSSQNNRSSIGGVEMSAIRNSHSSKGNCIG